MRVVTYAALGMRRRCATREGRADTDETGAEEPDEEDLDALLEWSDALNYDAYHADWLGLATSHRPDKYSTASTLVSLPGLAGAPQ